MRPACGGGCSSPAAASSRSRRLPRRRASRPRPQSSEPTVRRSRSSSKARHGAVCASARFRSSWRGTPTRSGPRRPIATAPSRSGWPTFRPAPRASSSRRRERAAARRTRSRSHSTRRRLRAARAAAPSEARSARRWKLASLDGGSSSTRSAPSRYSSAGISPRRTASGRSRRPGAPTRRVRRRASSATATRSATQRGGCFP